MRAGPVTLTAVLLVACTSGAQDVVAPPVRVLGNRADPADVRAAAPGADLPDLSGGLRLETLLPLLLARNPDVAAARAALAGAAERYPQAVSLPDPMVEARYFARNAMAPGESFARYDLMVRQEFPFPTVLGLRGEVAQEEARAAALRYEAVVRDVVADLTDVHAERAYLYAAARVQAAVRDVYRRYAELARSGLGGGRTRLPESFRAEALLAQAGYEQELVEEVLAVEDQRLRALLVLPHGAEVGEPEDVAPWRVELSVDELVRRALAYNQELQQAGVEVETARLSARLARYAFAPTFSLGGGRMVNDDFDMESGRTRDSTVVSLGVTVPIWFQARAAGVREADLRVRSARASETARRERLVAEVARAAFRARNAGRLATFYGAELVPQAEAALLRSEALVAEGQESLASSLELAATWQQLRIAELRAVADQVQAVAALERLLGTTVAPVDAASEEER